MKFFDLKILVQEFIQQHTMKNFKPSSQKIYSIDFVETKTFLVFAIVIIT